MIIIPLQLCFFLGFNIPLILQFFFSIQIYFWHLLKKIFYTYSNPAPTGRIHRQSACITNLAAFSVFWIWFEVILKFRFYGTGRQTAGRLRFGNADYEIDCSQLLSPGASTAAGNIMGFLFYANPFLFLFSIKNFIQLTILTDKYLKL